MNDWEDTTREEMHCFIGFLYGISINKIAEISDIWSSDWVVASPAFASFLGKDRFRALWSSVHLADNERAHQRGTREFNKLYKVRPIMDILGRSFKNNFNLGQNVSVDEAMVKGKGCNPLKQSKGDLNCGALAAPAVHTCGTSKSMQEKKQEEKML